MKEEINKLKQPTMFIDTQDMEERYAEGLYMDYLKEENQKLKKKYENAVADYEYEKSKNQRAIEYIENNRLFYFEYDEEEIFEHVTDLKVSEKLIEILKGENK